jgi:large repetitive protein
VEGKFVSLLNRFCQRRIAVVGFGVVAVSLFATVAPAVAAAGPSRTTLSSSTPSVGIGGTAKLKAVVKAVTGTLKPTGTVTFREGTTISGTVTLALVGSVQTAKLDIAALPVGSHTFIATYNGSIDFATSVSLPVTIVVGKGSTTTTASSSTPAPLVGQDAKVKAVVKQTAGAVKPTGSVTFSEGATTLNTVPLALVGSVETAKYTIVGLALGSHTITATYSGSTTFDSSISTVTVTVTKGSSTVTITNTPDAANPGMSTLVAVVKAIAPAKGVPTGIATFVVDGLAPQIVALTATGRAQLNGVPTPVGTHTVRVTYGGDTLFLTSVGTLTFTS